MLALQHPKWRRGPPRRVRKPVCLPINFTQTTRVRFLDDRDADSSHLVTYGKGEVVTDLIVTDFDDFSAILEDCDGHVAYGVPKSRFIAKPNF